jgi:hypothetical protein
MKRMLPNISNQRPTDRRKSLLAFLERKQETVSMLPEHPVAVLFHKSSIVNVKRTERIQYTVDNTNTTVVRVRSHFRARLWSPLVLFDIP